jgi:hypothetical protein
MLYCSIRFCQLPALPQNRIIPGVRYVTGQQGLQKSVSYFLVGENPAGIHGTAGHILWWLNNRSDTRRVRGPPPESDNRL